MMFDFVSTVFVARHCPPWDEPHGYKYEGGSSRLARFSGLRTNSTVVYHRADNGMRGIMPSKCMKYYM
jgi:hypothetical protein